VRFQFGNIGHAAGLRLTDSAELLPSLLASLVKGLPQGTLRLHRGHRV